MNPLELFTAIGTAAPGFKSVMAEHLADNGELLPHLLMSDLLRYIGRSFKSNGNNDPAPSRSEITAVLALLDTAAVSGSEETKNAIAVSFCEHVETETFFPQLRGLLGLGLRRHMRSFNLAR
jgi:hypothetical protein